MKLAHISKYKRTENQLGGVEKFAYYLSRVFPDLKLYSFADCSKEQGGPDWEKAERLNTQLLEEQKIDQDTIVIVDGYWGRGLGGKVKAIVNVAHGTYIGEAWSNEIFPYANASAILAASREQHKAYQEADIVVAVSQRTEEELWKAYGILSTKILNGIDLQLFKPDSKRDQDLILHAATGGRKQLELVEAIRATARELKIEPFGVQSGILEEEAQRWQEGAVFFQPALYEGCSYASLESMACGCVPVAYNTGVWSEVPEEYGIFVEDHHVLQYMRGLQTALQERGKYQPRKWAEKYADFSVFQDSWTRLIQSCN